MCNPISTARPESLLAKGIHLGFEWEVTANHSGFRCGYVRIPPAHPWYGVDYDDIAADVHGGLTFAQPDAHCGKDGPDDSWWIGFDCAHYQDASDPELPGYHHLSLWKDGTIRTTEYVTAECVRLAEQAAVVLDGPVGILAE
jgi:hypothetical protein